MPLLSCVKCPIHFNTNKKKRYRLLKFRENVLCPQVNFYICPKKKTITTLYICRLVHLYIYTSIGPSPYLSPISSNVLVLLVFTKPDCFSVVCWVQIVSVCLIDSFLILIFVLFILSLSPRFYRCFCVCPTGLMGVYIAV